MSNSCPCSPCITGRRKEGGERSIGLHRVLYWPRWALWALESGRLRAGGIDLFGNPKRSPPQRAHRARQLARSWLQASPEWPK